MLPRQNSDTSTSSITPLLKKRSESTTISFFNDLSMIPSTSSTSCPSPQRTSHEYSNPLCDNYDTIKTVKSQLGLDALQEEEEPASSPTFYVPSSQNPFTNAESSASDVNGFNNNHNTYRPTYLPSFSTSVSWANPQFSKSSFDLEFENQIQNFSNPQLDNSGRTESASNLRRSSLARRISKVGSDLVSTAAEVAANSKIIRPPKIGDLFRGKQISLDLSALSFDATEKKIDVEEALNQRIKAITGELLSQYYVQEMSENEDKSGFGMIKQFISKGIGKFGFWIIVSVLAILTFKDVVDLVLDYSSDPKQSDMNIMFNESMAMPNITFCMSRPQAWSHFSINPNETTEEWNQFIDETFDNLTTKELFLNSPWNYRLVMEAYDVIATLNSMERETTPHGTVRSIHVFKTQPRLTEKRATVKKWMEILKEKNINFEELTQKVGFETIRRSIQRFQRTTYDENLLIKTKLRTSWISMMQFCFQPWFDHDNFVPIKDQGNFFTMVLSHNPEKLHGKQVECMSVDFHGRPSSLSRFMEGKGRTRDGFNDEICPGMVHEVTVEVKAQYIMLENTDNGTACNTIQPGEDTEFDCRSRCRLKMIREICNCTALTLSYLETAQNQLQYPLCDYSKCNVDVQNKNYSDKKCSEKCYRDCNQIRYEIDHETKGRSVRPDISTVYLNWGSFEFLTLEQHRIWSMTTFIAALGGSIGMWLGLSILSLLQGATYIFYLFRESKKKQRKNSNFYSTNPLSNPFKPKISGPPPSYEHQQSDHRTNIQVN